MNDVPKALIDARTIVNDFVKDHSPKCRTPHRDDEIVNWNFASDKRPLDFSLNLKFEGWAQDMSLSVKDGHASFSWSATERDMSNAVAFLARANEIVVLGAKLELLVRELFKTLNKKVA